MSIVAVVVVCSLIEDGNGIKRLQDLELVFLIHEQFFFRFFRTYAVFVDTELATKITQINNQVNFHSIFK